MLISCILIFLTLLVSPVYADSKTIISEAIYSMGDGETPSSVEAMVLQKAKQRALEEAGTYVESYTHVRNLDLTIDEIKTIAGGVMKTEIVEQNRALERNRTRFYIKIRALVTTDKIEDLARRKQLGPLAAENKRLQDDLVKLTRDLEAFKRQILQSKTESEREVVLEKIREVEKQFRQVRSTETTLYRRLVSGEELSAQVDKAFREEERRREIEQRQRVRQKESLERVLATLKSNGHTITISLPETEVSLDQPDTVTLRFVVTVEASEEAKSVIHDLHEAYKADFPDDAAMRIGEVLNRLALVLTVSLQDGREYVSNQQHIHNFKSPRSYDLKQMVQNRPSVAHITVPIPRSVVSLVASVEGKIEALENPVVETLQTTLNISGTKVANPYWARVQAVINSHWEPPPIDMAGQTYTMVVKFRLQRDGTIKNVVVQQSSGNAYYDLAGQRAVLKPRMIPAFPADMTDNYKDMEIVFRVGE